MLVVRDSRLLRIVKKYAGLIVGSILGIPAIVVLCYVSYLKRLKRYTETFDVSPRQTICHHKKSERYSFWIMIVYHWFPNFLSLQPPDNLLRRKWISVFTFYMCLEDFSTPSFSKLQEICSLIGIPFVQLYSSLIAHFLLGSSYNLSNS